MGWDYRVIRRTWRSEQAAGSIDRYSIHEVYYARDPGAGASSGAKIAGHSAESVRPIAQSLDDLHKQLSEMLGALDKPVIEQLEGTATIQLSLSREEAEVLFSVMSRYSDFGTLSVENLPESLAVYSFGSTLAQALLR